MKKALLYIFGILALITIGTSIFYWVRKKNALQHYVSVESQSVIAVSLDDIVIDNMDQLFRDRKNNEDFNYQFSDSLWFDLWNSGLKIPAKVYLFSIKDQAHTFYSIQQVSNQKKWKDFLHKYSEKPKETEAQNDPSQIINLNKYVYLIHKNDDVILCFSLDTVAFDKTIENQLLNKENWTAVKDLTGFQETYFSDHITLWNASANLNLKAHISGKDIKIAGSWTTKNTFKHDYLSRSIAIQDKAVIFSNSLPLSGFPLLKTAMHQFLGIDSATLTTENIDYMDFTVTNRETLQPDTIITYDYDENFNSVEKKEIRQIPVPLIEGIWKADEMVGKKFPNKIFYTLYQSSQNGFTSYSTDETSLQKISYTMNENASPLQLYLNFSNWPEAWSIGTLRHLKESNLHVTIQTNLESSNQIAIKGYIGYRR
ncbi:hypothetical protein [Sphingobacterium sp. LRF_L2]|uniref:hypothetical protein n=1 Tax=Sphingobacterium sp. LRF_L2 TaxID=3369421 RepID=UPI003F5E71D4